MGDSIKGEGDTPGSRNTAVSVLSSSSANETTAISPSGKQTYYKDHSIPIPESEKGGFSFRKLWAFTGPGFLMSIAYLDPGNIESDLKSGSMANYKLLWVLLAATGLGLMMQRLSARLGVVTGLHLAEMCYRQYRKLPRLVVWVMIEIAIIGSDMQEVIGTAVALYLLTNKGLPLWAGVLITVIDTFTFLLLDKYGLRKLELLFGSLIAVMAVTFGFEYVVSKPDQLQVLKGMVYPWCEGCSHNELQQAVGIVGAVIMPHNLYLHSALVKSRNIDRKKPEKVKEANMYFFIEATLALVISFVINVFVVAVFANGLYGKTNQDVYETCVASGSSQAGEFANNTEIVDVNIYKGGIFLGCNYGVAAMYIWAIGILAAGQSSTMTGCYAGQFAMEGFLNLQWKRWRRVIFTRTIAIVPTFCVAFFSQMDDLSGMNDFLNAVMSLQLPFATLPTVAFTSNPAIMGEFVNGRWTTISAILLSAVVIFINVYYVTISVTGLFTQAWLKYLVLTSVGTVYLLFCLYLVIHMFASMGISRRLSDSRIIQKYFYTPVTSNFSISNHSNYSRSMDHLVEEKPEYSDDKKHTPVQVY